MDCGDLEVAAPIFARAARHQTYAELSAELRHDYDLLTAPPLAAAKSKKPLALLGAVAALAIAVGALLHFSPWKRGAGGAGTPRRLPSSVAQETRDGARVPPSPASATNDAPFVNSLGMKFVPVPITGGATGGQRVLFSVWDTRVQDYEVFAMETKRKWPKADFEQGPTHPAVYVNWEDATAFCVWLTERERKAGRLAANESYRLPSDPEWSCAVGIGDKEDAAKLPDEKGGSISDTFPWGTQWPPPENAGNYASEELQKLPVVEKFRSINGVIAGYRDGYANTAPAGTYAANRLNLFDMGGNVWQWCGDWFEKERQNRVLRGASWTDGAPGLLLSSLRGRGTSTDRSNFSGFRCVLETAPSPAPAGR